MMRSPMRSRGVLVLLAVAGGVLAFALAATRSLVLGAVVGVIVLGVVVLIVRSRVPRTRPGAVSC